MWLMPPSIQISPVFGISILQDGDAVTLSFGLERIAMFRTSFGADDLSRLHPDTSRSAPSSCLLTTSYGFRRKWFRRT